MNWTQLTANIDKDAISYVRAHNPQAIFDNVAIFTDLDHDPSDKTLWLADVNMLYTIAQRFVHGQYSLILLNTNPSSIVPLLPREVSNIISVSSLKEFQDMYSALQNIFDSIRFLEYHYKDLARMCCQTPTLNQLADKIAEMYPDSQVFITNNTLSLIGNSQFNERFYPLKEDIENKGINPTFATEMEIIEEGLPEDFQMFHVIKHPNAFFKSYQAKIQSNSVTVGYLDIFVDSSTYFSTAQLSYLPNIANMLSNRLQQNDFQLLSKSEQCSQILLSILDGQEINEELLKKKMFHFGYNLKENKRLLVVRPQKANLTTQQMFYYGLSIKQAFDNSIVIAQNQALIFLISSSTDDHISQEQQMIWSNILSKDNMALGISANFKNLLESSTRLNEAFAALDTGAYFYPIKNVYFFDNLRIHYIAKKFLKYHTKGVSLLYPPVLEILHYDLDHDTQLLYTLYTYLRFPEDPQKICDILFIHKNTLYQRLKKIRTFLPDITSIHIISQIYFSLLVLKKTDYLYFEIEME